jgi:hypothetical protein
MNVLAQFVVAAFLVQQPSTPARDFGRVFSGPADNILLVKVSRWFSR